MHLSLLSFSFLGETLSRQMDADRLCRIAKENGVEYLDMMVTEIRLYRVKTLKKAFSETGVRCDCVTATLPFFRGVEKYPVKLDAAFKTCEQIGANKLMIVPGAFDAKVCRQLRREEMQRRMIELYSMAVKRGKERGIEILFEDTPQAHKPLSSAADCRAVLDAVPGLGFVFDTANFLVAEVECDLLADYELLKDRICRVHLKDVERGRFRRAERCENGESIRCVTTGSGIVPLRPFVKRLQADGYDGVACVEYAAKATVHGDAHGEQLKPYVQKIRSYLSDKALCNDLEEAPC